MGAVSLGISPRTSARTFRPSAEETGRDAGPRRLRPPAPQKKRPGVPCRSWTSPLWRPVAPPGDCGRQRPFLHSCWSQAMSAGVGCPERMQLHTRSPIQPRGPGRGPLRRLCGLRLQWPQAWLPGRLW